MKWSGLHCTQMLCCYMYMVWCFRYTFLCNDWISPVQTQCYGHEIYSTNMQEGTDFIALFKSNTKTKVFDDHLWLSVVKRPNKSNFSRVQRWSLCIATLYLTMVVNAMWFPTEPVEEDETASTTLKIGPIELSWRTIYVSFMGKARLHCVTAWLNVIGPAHLLV